MDRPTQMATFVRAGIIQPCCGWPQPIPSVGGKAGKNARTTPGGFLAASDYAQAKPHREHNGGYWPTPIWCNKLKPAKRGYLV